MTDLIAWDANRFVIREYTETRAIYIYDRISHVGYINQTEMARLAECRETALSGFTKKLPKELKSKLGVDSLGFTMIQNPTNNQPWKCLDHDQFWVVLNYYAQYASGCEKREKAKELVFKIGFAGSLTFLLHQTGITLTPSFDEPIEIKTIDAHQWRLEREEGKADRREFTDALALSWEENNYHWTMVEGLTKEGFYAKWTDYVYSMLFGTNAAGLRKVAFCPKGQSLVVGRNHLSAIAFLKALAFVESEVAEQYNSKNANNLKWLIVKAAKKAHRFFPLPESPKYLETVEWLPQIEPFKPNLLPPNED